MKKWLFLALVPFLFSGCGIAGKYNEGYISQSIEKNYKKVDSVSFGIIKNNETEKLIRTQEKVFANPVVLEMDANKISNEIFYNTYSQYFSNIKFVTNYKESEIVIKFQVIDYKFYFPYGITVTSNMTLESCFLITVFYKEKNILEKKYFSKKNTDVITNFIPGYNAPVDNIIELFHKEINFILDNEFKQDLLNAL